MKTNHRYYLSIFIGLLVLIYLIYQTNQAPLVVDHILSALLFMVILVFTTTFGVPLAGGTMSLLPMSTLAAFLVLDVPLAGWCVFLAAATHQIVSQIFGKELGIPPVQSKIGFIAVGIANAAIQTLSILVGAWAYKSMGGQVPFTRLDLNDFLALLVLALVYSASNLLLIALYMAARGMDSLKMYLRSMRNLAVYEVIPLIFVPLMPLIYTQLGLGMFVLFAVALIVASLIARRLSLATRGLERRVQELDSLQVVGQTLSSNLRLADILPTIYDQVVRLMPTDSFYVALYYPEEYEVTFPFVVEAGIRVEWRSRKAGDGMTEYILRTGEPLLIPANVEARLEKLGIPQIGSPAASWLGVPMCLGDDPLGVIVLQSQTATALYDESHLDILVTIANQAAVSIQNARLYERTDEALSSRLRELSSILRTSAEGMLLLSTDFRVILANRALAHFLKVPITELSCGEWGTHHLDQSKELLLLMDYTAQELKSDCDALGDRQLDELKKSFKMRLSPGRHLERTLTPVLDKDDQISGWLLVFRDISEEVKLAQMREDLVHMLVHDLRSPLTVLKGSFALLLQTLEDKQQPELAVEMIGLAERSTNRMMEMVNGLLDIAKLEEGQMPLYTKPISVAELFQDVILRVQHLVDEANLKIESVVDSDLPELQVDPQHIRRVLENILDNAIKFTPDGGKIRLWARRDVDASPAMYLLSVTDTGPGVASELKKKLFKKFTMDSHIQSRRKGTGLGLAYCKLVVEAHGGEIWVESEEGEGATFVMRLPAMPK
jgi:two-component system, NtrC family, sensor histidine kinase KinB